MKLSVHFMTAVFGCVLSAGLMAQETKAPAAAFTEPQIIETWGWTIAREKGVAGIEISKTELATFLKGFDANLNREPPPCNLREVFPNLQQLARARREKLVQATIRRNEAEAQAFFTLLKKNTNVFELPNGLCYEILKPGSGPGPKPAQTVNLHYFGHLLDGTEFAEFGPLDTILVTNRAVCRGWVDALQKLNRGGKMKLHVPPPLSEREAEGLGIEPGSAMVFDIELFDIKDTLPQDLADATMPPAPEGEPPLAAGHGDLQLMEAWGWSVAQQTQAGRFGFGKDEIAALTKGLAAGIEGRPAPQDLSQIYPEIKRFVNNCHERVRLADRQKQLDEMNALFAGLKKNTNVVELPDGLRYEILKPGRGPSPKPGQIVIVDFTGCLVNGTVFDRTDNEPLHVEVGSMTRGFNEGIQKINAGGRIRLYVPPELGFGGVATSGDVAAIPPDSTLIYDIELQHMEDATQGKQGEK
jgi:FKBP-type peptidyl-prolyl cis-trans isomerase